MKRLRSRGNVGRSRMSHWGNREQRPVRAAPRVHIKSMSERSAGVDERLASIFQNMRRGLNIPVDKLALALKTTPHVIQLLEAGQVRAFPPWPETVRLVTELGRLYRVDTRPILNRIRDQVGPVGLEQVPEPRDTTISATAVAAKLDGRHPLVRAMSRGRRQKGASLDPEVQRRAKRRKRRTAKTLFTLSAPIALLGALVWLAQAQPWLIMQAVSVLPEPVAKVVRPAANALIVHLAPWRDGMRWIEVGDPRLRKTDKLRQASR
jgi:hypothetical protein